jgi:uroporphyrinogen III methyltransferase/synthase
MSQGKVYLVGAGPGDPGLITVKGLGCIQNADVIVYDRLVDDKLLAKANHDAELIDVGKIPGETGRKQTDITRLLVEKAKQGKNVVRLKGGDPFVFGRGGEEAELLHDNGIPFEIVPGVSSAVAAPAYAGIPLTHRKRASYFTVVTGNEDPTKPDSAIDWQSLAKSKGTIVVLMGWQNLPSIINTLIVAGRSPDTPIALVQWGTEPYQKTVTGKLSTIVDIALEQGIASPVVTVIGDVVGLRDKLRWFDNRPLFGKKVLITRTRAQAGALSEMLYARGAQPIELPTIEIKELEDCGDIDNALHNLSGYDWVVFTSVNAVKVVFTRLNELGLDSRAFHRSKVCAIGPATADSLRHNGIVADYIPGSFVSEAVVDGLGELGVKGQSILLPRADIARKALKDGLANLGAIVDEVAVYSTITPEDSSQIAERVLSEGVDVITFTSSSTVTNLVELLDGKLELLENTTIACIGPITAKTAEESGMKVDVVANEYTISGLVDSLEACFTRKDVSNEYIP